MHSTKRNWTSQVRYKQKPNITHSKSNITRPMQWPSSLLSIWMKTVLAEWTIELPLHLNDRRLPANPTHIYSQHQTTCFLNVVIHCFLAVFLVWLIHFKRISLTNIDDGMMEVIAESEHKTKHSRQRRRQLTQGLFLYTMNIGSRSRGLNYSCLSESVEKTL